jgi:hypothetical protein
VIDVPELLAAVDDAFRRTSDGLAPWPDPHPDRSPPEEAYSRLTQPAKWRILGTRTDAWLIALAGAGLAVVDADAEVTWKVVQQPEISRVERVVPIAVGALELVVGHSRLGDVDDAGVVLGLGDPAETVTWFPSCGCDACDSGSQRELDELDTHLLSIVTGAFRRLWDGDRRITVLGAGRWEAANFGLSARSSFHEVPAILADPRGWREIAGASWLPTSV